MFFCLLSVLWGGNLSAQRGFDAYLDMDLILAELSEYQKASRLLDERILKWKEEIELKKLQAKQLREQLGAEKFYPRID